MSGATPSRGGRPARRPASGPDPATRRLVLLGAGGFIALAAGFVYGNAVHGGDVVRSGTTVLGVDIGGQTPEQAQATLRRELGPAATRPLRLTAGGASFAMKPAAAGLRFDEGATVDAAMGDDWNPLSLLGLGGHEVEPVISVDQPMLDAKVQQVADSVKVAAVEPAIAYEGTLPMLSPGSDGVELDTAAATQAIVSAYMRTESPVGLATVVTRPSVSEESAQGVRDGLATTAVSAPIRVEVDQTPLTLQPASIAAALTFVPTEGTLAPRIDGARVHESLAPSLTLVEIDGRNATFEIVKGVPVVVPSQDGQEISDDKLAEAIAGALGAQGDDRVARVSIEFTTPELTTEEAQALGVTEKLSSFTQEFPYAPYRVQNIGQAATYIDGTLLMPGATFSMNDTIKERTKANGYTEGLVVGPGGILREDLGGGVSAATTTVWTAAFFAGLERVYTQAHSIYISRYQPGLEATVSWGGFDMKFRNDTPYGVFITTKMTNESMTVTMWGTKVYDEVKAEFGEWVDKVTVDKIYDPSKKCIGQPGAPGFTIAVDRVFYQGGAEVRRETITTHYDPSPEVVCEEPPAPPSPSPSASESSASSAEPAP